MNETMQAIRFQAYGGPEQLMLERVARPQAQPGSVLVRVKAAGVNPIDWKLRLGVMQKFMPVQMPHTPGLDLAGLIEEVGPDVTGWQRGQAVYGTGTGTYAEFAVALATGLAPKPATLTFDQAASVPIGALTAWRALIETANLQAGQRLLVQGAAGGVGVFAVQLARWRGAHVIGTASAGNLDFVRSLGADAAIDYQTTAFENEVHDVDVALDTVGGDVKLRSLQVLRPGGLLVTIAGQPPHEEAQERGVRAESVRRTDPARDGEILRQVGELVDAGQIKVEVTNVFPLAEAGQAHALSQTGHGRGRIVLHVAD